jgi:hypothetical protein
MKVIDGRWQDQDGKPINDFNGSKFIEIREKVKVKNKTKVLPKINHIFDRKKINGKNKNEKLSFLSFF